jgi:PAS domain S-box-containing protein
MSSSEAPSPTAEVHAVLAALPCAALLVETRDAELVVAGVNAACGELLGTKSAQIAGRSLISLASPDADATVHHEMRDALSNGRAYNAEWRVRRRDGVDVWVRIRTRAFDAARVLAVLEDIDACKQARASLRISEPRLAVAMEASDLAMWDWNVVADEISYNDRWGQFGVDPHELLLRESLAERLVLPSDDAALLERFEQHFHGATSDFVAEYQTPARGGDARWGRLYARVVRRTPEGRAQRVIGVLRDITARKREQRESLEAVRRWERAVRGTSDGLYDWDLNTGYVWYAARFREIVGYADDAFPDAFLAFQNVLHADDRALVLGRIRAHLENRVRLDLRCRVVTRSGGVIWCRLRGEAERDAAGRPLRLSGSLSDVTGQVEAEEALTRSQDFYGTILDSLPLHLAYADRDERILYANRMWQNFLGVRLANVRGRCIREIISERLYAAVGPYVREALQGKDVEGQGRLRDVEGRSVDLEAVFFPHRDESGDILGCFVAARDVTEKRLLEAELRQSQKMEAVGRLTGGIAHDFNNLLSVIVGNMQLLARNLRESPRMLRQTETALNAAMRGAALTRRLLAFARQQVLEPKTVDLNALLSGMYELLRRTLTGDIEIRQQLAPELWTAKLDPGQLENAVLNLVINARDAMPEGGVITIHTRNVTIAERSAHEEGLASGDYAVLDVTDTGLGMPPDIVKRAFEPFFTTKEVGKGSGLGLSMVYGFVRQSGGYASITSEVGCGATVHLYFPRSHSRVESQHAELHAAADLPRGRETLLVVEDSVEVRMTAVEILRTLGYRVIEASNGRQALEQFLKRPDIALVFSDVMLPGGLLGPQLVQKLREHRPSMKVLMTTGFSESNIASRELLDGSIDVLPKPYRVEDLARRIRALLDNDEEKRRVQM